MKCDRRWYNDGRVRLDGLSPFEDFPHIKLPVSDTPDPALDAISAEIDTGMRELHDRLVRWWLFGQEAA